jgi:hypothetical protein
LKQLLTFRLLVLLPPVACCNLLLIPGEADALQHLFGHEKQLRDRNSLLVCVTVEPKQDFTASIQGIDVVQSALAYFL